MTSDSPTTTDVPLRTWRQWWIQKPSWFRILVWGAAIFVAVHAMLAVRIAIGLQESSVVTAFRQQGIRTPLYFWQGTSKRFPGEHWLLSGLWGRRPGCVTIVFFYQGGSDEDLQYVATHFRNLQHLVLNNAEVSSAGLHSLQACRGIQFLDLTDTDLQDADLEFLRSFPRLRTLNLSGTQITDAAIPLLQSLPQLESLDVRWTSLSPTQLGAWTNAEGKSITITTKLGGYDQGVLASIRWADGSVGERFPANADVYLDSWDTQPYEAAHETHLYGNHLARTELCCQVDVVLGIIARDLVLANELGEDITSVDLTMRMKLGGYDSEPVPIVISDGKLAMRHIEFCMPVTREEALKASERRESAED